MNLNYGKAMLIFLACVMPGASWAAQEEFGVNSVENVQATIKVTGTVSDANEPLIGATVKEKANPSNGVMTDMNGNFTINVQPGATLVISYLGYVTREVKVGNSSQTLNIVLEEDSKSLDEVVGKLATLGFKLSKEED